MENKISVVINTYNAERHLKEVLESVKDFDEIVVCDMESTDHTLAIAREYGCKIVTFAKKDYNIVEPAREFAIHQTTYPWVLVVDADELVTPELRQYLYHRIAAPDCPQGFFIPRQNRFMNIPQTQHIGDHQLRFFVASLTTWPPVIHAIPVVKGRVEKLSPDNNLMLIHLAENSLHEMVEKGNVYTDNEVVKRANKNYGAGALLWRPFWRFFKAYVMNGKWKYGTMGLIDSMITAYYQFLLVAKIIEKRINQQ
jgi:glycosyltransferase involved in cell wall biosynthesis